MVGALWWSGDDGCTCADEQNEGHRTQIQGRGLQSTCGN